MRNLLFLGALLDRQVTVMVTHMVICVFHAPVTFLVGNSRSEAL